MKFVQRLGYYLGGVSIGIIILLFFLNGKDASCDYGPNARTVKNITLKKFQFSEATTETLMLKSIDTAIVRELIRYGDVNFSESNTKSKRCKTYKVENTYRQKDVYITVKNCESIAEIIGFAIK